MGDIVIICNSECGKTTEDIPEGIKFGNILAGKFKQVDESGVPEWTCFECLENCPDCDGDGRVNKHLDRHFSNRCPSCNGYGKIVEA